MTTGSSEVPEGLLSATLVSREKEISLQTGHRGKCSASSSTSSCSDPLISVHWSEHDSQRKCPQAVSSITRAPSWNDSWQTGHSLPETQYLVEGIGVGIIINGRFQREGIKIVRQQRFEFKKTSRASNSNELQLPRTKRQLKFQCRNDKTVFKEELTTKTQ